MSVSSSSFSSPWPDPNSPVLAKIDFGVPLVELFKWVDVRDTLFGQNLRKQDITAAFALARDCKHPDAQWLTSIFEGKDVSTEEEARKVLLCCENDARALCFAWCLSNDRLDRRSDLALLRRAAEMGNAFACSVLCDIVSGIKKEETFRLARLAAAQHECIGFFLLGLCFLDSIGCEKDLNLAKQNLLIAAELGNVWAAESYGRLLDVSDPDCWLWWSRAALRGSANSFLDSCPKQVEEFFSGSGDSTIVFLIGRALKANIDVEKKQIFGLYPYKFDSLISRVNQAISLYDSQIKFARLAVGTWALIATRIHVMKDIRILIGKMIWEARFEANYKIENDLLIE